MIEILQLISLAPFDRTQIKQLFENAEYQDVKEQKYTVKIVLKKMQR